MGEKLVELFVGAALRPQTPWEQLAKAVVKLLTAMTTCHEAYMAYNSDANLAHNDEAALRRRWYDAVTQMGDSIAELRTVFAIHDVELGQIVGDYFMREKPVAYKSYMFKRDVAEGILEKVPLPARTLTEDTQSTDFDIAIAKLKVFIRDTLKLTREEILSAQNSIL
jgi:hypothetical protein